MNALVRVPGPVAQDKDWAREARLAVLFPTLQAGGDVVLDFVTVHTATQSFIHALLSDVTRSLGETGLSRIEFRSCNGQVRQAIQTVTTYSLRARNIAIEAVPTHDTIRSEDVPQADDLQKVRALVDQLADGPAPFDLLADASGYSIRHVQYRLAAARILNFIQVAEGMALATTRGTALIATNPASIDEQSELRTAIADSRVIRMICPSLLGRRGPDPARLASEIVRLSGLAATTAQRRANCLLSWRRQVLQTQEPLAF